MTDPLGENSRNPVKKQKKYVLLLLIVVSISVISPLGNLVSNISCAHVVALSEKRKYDSV